MARAFKRKGQTYVASMDEAERAVVAGLMAQTRDLLAPDVEPTGDPFTDLVASLGPDFAKGMPGAPAASSAA
jgi:hypothetical protein